MSHATNAYFLGVGTVLNRVQLDTGPGGQPPFLVETDSCRLVTSDVAEAVAAGVAGLGAGDGGSADELP
ncbi:hypothetical protein [Streptomyces sp. NPDC048659]|uniref:hypothetical protein n=1 Tax=Streptomyces sp. NPDC048659 TaxID=3155489 RepID=UPI0034467C23